MTRSTVRLVLAISFLLASMPPPTLAIGELVWSVTIEGDRAVCTTNEFATGTGRLSGRSFPVRHLRINKLIDLSTGEGESRETRILTRVAPLGVNEDGTLQQATLDFLLAARMALDPSGKRLTFLGFADDAAARKASSLLPVRYVHLPQIRGQNILGWEHSADGRYGLIHTDEATIFFDATATAPPGPPTVRRSYPWRTYGAAMSDDPEWVALIATNERQQKVVVFTLDGGLIFEEDSFTHAYYDQLYLTPSGETLILDRTRKGEEVEAVALDLRDGSTKVLETLVKGIRYYSRDGTRLVVLQGGYGKVFTYDSSDPYDPELLWTREMGRLTDTAAVSPDGSYVALQTVINRPQGQTTAVLVLDSHGNDLAEPLSETKMAGLQFEESFLFVGTQRHPVPAYLGWETTREIQVFDFAE